MSRRSTGSVWSYPNVHGDVVATADGSGVKQGVTTVYGPFGEVLAGVVPDSVVGGMDAGWLGQHQRRSDAGSGRGVIQMGVRPYVPAAGRFLGVDPVEGGNANDYVYPQDPVNSFDLDGRMALPGGEWLCEGGGPAGCTPYSGKAHWAPFQFKKVGYKPNLRPANNGMPSFGVGTCLIFCLSVGYSKESGWFATPGVGMAVSLPSITTQNSPACGKTMTNGFAELGLGPVGFGGQWQRRYKSTDRYNGSLFGSVAPWSARSVAISGGAGAFVSKTYCSR